MDGRPPRSSTRTPSNAPAPFAVSDVMCSSLFPKDMGNYISGFDGLGLMVGSLGWCLRLQEWYVLIMTSQEHEHTVNVALADELKKRGLGAVPEVIHPGNRRIDVEVKIGPARIAVEAELEQTSAKKREAIGDADRRLPSQQNLADVAVAVCYPKGRPGRT